MPRIIFLVGIIAMVSVCGCSKPIQYERYSSKDAQINIAMDYVSGWSHSESRDANGGFARVVFTEPSRKDKILLASMGVTVRNFSKGGSESPSLSSFVDAELTRQRQMFQDMKVLFNVRSKSAVGDSVSLEMIHKGLNKMGSANNPIIPNREKMVILEKGGTFYIFEYNNAESDFAKFSEVFNHCLNSIEFKK